VGRTRHVRVYLTEEEHSVLRAAAALADLPLSQYAVRAIVDAARAAVPSVDFLRSTLPEDKPTKKPWRKKGK
jgi:uncharacterized protein (DUF1778 family)